MSTTLFDIKSIKEEAQIEMRKERGEKAKKALISQMRIVEAAKQVVRAEEMKLADIEAQIADGTF
jgi:hypothetical protein